MLTCFETIGVAGFVSVKEHMAAASEVYGYQTCAASPRDRPHLN